jgi:Domain of unknown function (DUF222)
LALLADELSGPERRCPGATDDELVGLLRAWAAIESWAAGAKLGVIREMMRRDGPPSPGSDHGDLPETWSRSLRYELAGALACSTQSAETTAWLAWEQGARLPGTAARLEDGTLTYAKARAVTETLGQLMDADAATAEAMIVDQLAGKTYTQVQRLAEQAALTVDPGLAERRREHAQKNNARVSFFREQAGTAALSGRDLPPDEALAAMANVSARAEEYKESGEFGDTPMDVLRAQAYLDLINGVTAAARIAAAEEQARAADVPAWARPGPAAREGEQDPGARDATEPGETAPGATDAREPGAPRDCPCAECDGSCLADDDLDGSGHSDQDDDPDGDDPDGDDPDGGGAPDSNGHGDEGDDPDDHSDPDDGGPGPGPGSGGPGPRPGAPAAGRARRPRSADLIVPLATLLGLAGRPGEIHGFGHLHPARQPGNPRRLRHLDARPAGRTSAHCAPGPRADAGMRPQIRVARLPAQ